MGDPVLEETGMTELLLAAYHGELEWMQNCVNAGLNIHARDNGGWTSLHWVVDMGMVGDGNERAEIVKFLLASGADIEATDNTGESVLWRAVSAGNDQLVQLLIDAGANPNKADNDGTTPLHLAISDEHKKMITVLKKAGASA